MKKFVIVVVIISIVLVIFFLINKDATNLMHDVDISEKNLDKEDSLLIRKSMLDKVSVENVLKTKTRNPIKYYKYKELYNLYLTRIDINNNSTMDKFVLFNEEITSPNSFIPYWNLQSNKFYNVKFRDEKVDMVSKIIFSMAGKGKELKKVVYNENFVSYCLPLYTFSLQYETKNNPIDVYIGARKSDILNKKGGPFIISFYKKEKHIYLILLTPINEETKLDEKILGEFIEY